MAHDPRRIQTACLLVLFTLSGPVVSHDPLFEYHYRKLQEDKVRVDPNVYSQAITFDHPKSTDTWACTSSGMHEAVDQQQWLYLQIQYRSRRSLV